jgi:hypothetical protein
MLRVSLMAMFFYESYGYLFIGVKVTFYLALVELYLDNGVLI